MKNNVKAIVEIPFKIEAESLKAKMRIKPGSDYDKSFDELVAQAQEIGRPKALYKVAYIDGKDADSVTMDGVTFTSVVMRKNLEDVNRVFPYVTTCGREVLGIEYDNDDLLKKYWLSVIRMDLLRISQRYLLKEIEKNYQMENLSSMNPGSGEMSIWPIEQQQELFSVFGDVQGMIGVELKPSCMMVPDMSVSGIIFATERSYLNCQLCQRANCPDRTAPFKLELWNEIHSS